MRLYLWSILLLAVASFLSPVVNSVRLGEDDDLWPLKKKNAKKKQKDAKEDTSKKETDLKITTLPPSEQAKETDLKITTLPPSEQAKEGKTDAKKEQKDAKETEPILPAKVRIEQAQKRKAEIEENERERLRADKERDMAEKKIKKVKADVEEAERDGEAEEAETLDQLEIEREARKPLKKIEEDPMEKKAEKFLLDQKKDEEDEEMAEWNRTLAMKAAARKNLDVKEKKKKGEELMKEQEELQLQADALKQVSAKAELQEHKDDAEAKRKIKYVKQTLTEKDKKDLKIATAEEEKELQAKGQDEGKKKAEDDELKGALKPMAPRPNHDGNSPEECNGWKPEYGPYTGKGWRCDFWGEKTQWCWVDVDPSRKETPKYIEDSEHYPGKKYNWCLKLENPAGPAEAAPGR